jgi:hypothetical protein
MTGMTSTGESASYDRRATRRLDPPGKLRRERVAQLQEQITAGLKQCGFSATQIAQVMRCGRATIERTLRQRRVTRSHLLEPESN